MPVITTNKPLKKRRERDFYPTPYALTRAFAASIFPVEYTHAPRVLDVGAGDGVWGIALGDECWTRQRPMPELVGVEIRDQAAGHSMRYADWIVGDFFSDTLPLRASSFDFVIGNPPYSLAQECVERGLYFLRPGGRLYFLLRLEFLASQKREAGFFWKYPPAEVWVCSARPSFTGDGKTDAVEYAIFSWQKPAPDQVWDGTRLYFWNWKQQIQKLYPELLPETRKRKKELVDATDRQHVAGGVIEVCRTTLTRAGDVVGDQTDLASA